MKLEKTLKKEFQNLHSTKYQITQRQIAICTSGKIIVAGFVARMIRNADNTLSSKHNGKGTN